MLLEQNGWFAMPAIFWKDCLHQMYDVISYKIKNNSFQFGCGLKAYQIVFYEIGYCYSKKNLMRYIPNTVRKSELNL